MSMDLRPMWKCSCGVNSTSVPEIVVVDVDDDDVVVVVVDTVCCVV